MLPDMRVGSKVEIKAIQGDGFAFQVDHAVKSILELVDADGRAPPTHPRHEQLRHASEEAQDVEIPNGLAHDPRMQNLDGHGDQALAKTTHALLGVVFEQHGGLGLGLEVFIELRE